MTTKERIVAELDRVGEENLDELYVLIKEFVAARSAPDKPGIMTKLKGVKIDAPADFAANLDLYTSGEKRVEENLH